jgi:ABC-type amino acid transport/signal transduction systems, periplasmic component/domain
MKFRRTALIVTTLGLVGALAACGSSSAGKSSGNDLGGKTVTVAVENQYPPFNYINKNTKKAEGWDYSAWRAICKKINCKPQFKETGFEGMIQAVSDKQFDAAADGITITAERAKVVDFSQGYIKVDQRLMVKKGESRFKTLAAFKSGSFKVGTQTGTTNFDAAKKEYGESRVQAFETFPFAVQALLNGDVDAVIIDDTAGQGYVGADSGKLELLPGSIKSDALGFIFPKGSDLVAPVNYALTQMKNDGSLKKISDHFFDPTFEAPAKG